MKIKVLVSGHDQKFWHPIQYTLQKDSRYIFKEDLWEGHSKHDIKKSQELLKWADVIICEWALGNAIYYSQKKSEHQKLIIRLHAQERNTKFPEEINYSNVDAIVFVSKHILQESVNKFNIPIEKVSVIPNVVNTQKLNQKKYGDSDFTIGMIGTVPLLKRMDLAFEILEYLQKINSKYTLRFKGKEPFSYTWIIGREKEREYYESVYTRINSSPLRYKVIFDPFGDDISSWLQYIGFILSLSDKESFHVAPAEGMASFAPAIMFKREGSSDIFPSVIKADTAELAAKQIDFYRRTKAGERYKHISHEFIVNNFSPKIIAEQWSELLNTKERKIESIIPIDHNKKLLVFFSIGNWETFHRREMIETLAKQIKNQYNIMIIEPGTHYKTVLNNKLDSQHNLNSMLQLHPIQMSENIFKIRIMNSGFIRGVSVSKILKQNSNYSDAIYKSLLEIFGKNTKITYWIQKPLQYKWIDKRYDFIYEVYDEYTMDFQTGAVKKDVLKEENQVLPLAKHVFFTSKPLADRKSHNAKSWSIVGNGVNFDIFSKYRIKEDVKSSKRNSVAYLGNLSNFFNWELMYQVVSQMPDLDFIFYGQLELENMGDRKEIAKKLISFSNTVFTGRVTREEGSVGINIVDVLIIPFVINDAMHAVNPLKLWEYFATGKPVISTPMDAIDVKFPYLRVASSSDEWIKNIRNAINEKDDKIKTMRVDLAHDNSWKKLILKYINVLDEIEKNSFE